MAPAPSIHNGGSAGQADTTTFGAGDGAITTSVTGVITTSVAGGATTSVAGPIITSVANGETTVINSVTTVVNGETTYIDGSIISTIYATPAGPYGSGATGAANAIISVHAIIANHTGSGVAGAQPTIVLSGLDVLAAESVVLEAIGDDGNKTTATFISAPTSTVWASVGGPSVVTTSVGYYSGNGTTATISAGSPVATLVADAPSVHDGVISPAGTGSATTVAVLAPHVVAGGGTIVATAVTTSA